MKGLKKMAKFTPYLFSEDARAQAEFYTQALGGEILSVMTNGDLPNSDEALKDKVLHLCVVAGGVQMFMSDFMMGTLNRGNNFSMALEFATEAEARQAFDNLAQGGIVTHPLQPEFWGDLFGQLEDKFGVNWMVTGKINKSEA
jgi:PhnB protein